MFRERCTVSTIDSSSLQSSKLSLVAPWRGNFHWERLKPGQAHGVSAETPSGRLTIVSANNTAWDSYSINKNMNEFASPSASLMCPLETDILSWYRVDTYQHFGETWQLSWRWMQQVSPKHWYTFQNPVILTCSAITPLYSLYEIQFWCNQPLSQNPSAKQAVLCEINWEFIIKR
jgi:hypothetical protein